MPNAGLSSSELWQQTVDQVKDRITHMSLWQTMEQTIGLVVEDDTLILGVPSRIINQAGYLQSPEHRNTIEKTLTRIAGRSMRIRVIEGECLSDWENLKKREERVKAMRDAAYDRSARRTEQAQSWDEVAEGAARAWSACTLRALPQTKARYVRIMANYINEAIARLCPDGPDEAQERLIAKTIDRVATNADVSPTVVALELERLPNRNAGICGPRRTPHRWFTTAQYRTAECERPRPSVRVTQAAHSSVCRTRLPEGPRLPCRTSR